MRSTSLDLYVNGTLETSTSTSLASEGISTSSSVIGADSTFANNFNGLIDELRVSKTSRYSGASYTVPASALTSDANTVSLHHFNETSGVTAAYSDTGATQNIGLNGTARFQTPLFAGSSYVVKDLLVNVSGAAVTLEMLTSGSSGAWTEINSFQTTPTVANSTTSLNGTSIGIYHNDGLNTSDLIQGLTTGFRLNRR